MAVGDKLVTLDGLKAVYQDVNGNIGDLKSAVEENTGNLFYLSKSNQDNFFNGTGVNGIKVTKHQDGSIEINGQTTASTSLWINEATRTNSTWLSAGTYSFRLEILGGTVNQEGNSAISLRAVSTSGVVLNYSTRTATATYENDVLCYLNFGNGYTYTNFRFRVTINKGSAINDYSPNKTGYDYIARNSVSNAVKSMSGLWQLLSMPEIPLQFYTHGNVCQAGTFIGDLFVYFRGTSSGTVSWRAIDIRDKSTVYYGAVPTPDGYTKTTDALGHCNDIAYNPVTGKMYVATLDENAPIAEMSVTITDGAPSFAYAQSIITKDSQNNTFIPSGIAYDRTNNCYYAFQQATDETTGYIIKYDTSWGYVGDIIVDTTIPKRVRQGIDTDGVYIYVGQADNITDRLTPVIQKYAIADGSCAGIRKLYLLEGQEMEGIAYHWETNTFWMNNNIKTPFPKETAVYIVDPDGTDDHIASKLAFLKG